MQSIAMKISSIFKYFFFSSRTIWVFVALLLGFSLWAAPEITPNLIGGLGIFLFGMVVMSDGLQAVAGTKMRKILTVLVKNRVAGVFTGFTVTAVMQSSSATTVMLVGFVNARLLTLRQAIGVIFGANIGTTITAFIVALNISKYFGPIIAVGVFFVIFSKNTLAKNFGNALFGFGLLFLGMYLMKHSMDPLSKTEFFSNLILQFKDTPILGLLTGMFITMVIQSSSATEGLIATMAIAGILPFEAAVPMLLGSNIGTTVTAQLAALTASRTAKRVALVHTMFNLFGAVIAFIFLKYYIVAIKEVMSYLEVFVRQMFPEFEINQAFYCAVAHMFFNIFNCLLFIPFVGVLEKLSKVIIPIKKLKSKTEAFSAVSVTDPLPMLKLKASDKAIIHPSAEFYITPAVNAIHCMLKYAKEGLEETKGLLNNTSGSSLSHVEKIEEVVDRCQITLNNYIEKAIIAHDIRRTPPMNVASLNHAVNDIENIGDLMFSLAKRISAMNNYKIKINDEEKKQMEVMFSKVLDMMDLVLEILENGKKDYLQEIAHQAYILENDIDAQLRTFRNLLRDKPLEEGFGWYIANISDIYSDLENIGDKLKNVLEAFGYPEGRGMEINDLEKPMYKDEDELN